MKRHVIAILALPLLLVSVSHAGITEDEMRIINISRCRALYETNSAAPFVYDQDKSDSDLAISITVRELKNKYSGGDFARMMATAEVYSENPAPISGDFRKVVLLCRELVEVVLRRFQTSGKTLP